MTDRGRNDRAFWNKAIVIQPEPVIAEPEPPAVEPEPETETQTEKGVE